MESAKNRAVLDWIDRQVALAKPDRVIWVDGSEAQLEQLRQEYAENEAKLQQYRHRVQRLEQRKKYYEKGERQKRAHRLITRGAAVESVAPEVKPLSEQGFYSLAEQIFSMPEVRAAVHAAAQREGR